jgi:hypothetical protein
MKNYRKLLSLLIVAALTAVVAYWLRPNDTKRIKKRFHQACTIVSKSSAENPAVSAFKMFDFGSLCADSVTFNIQGAPLRGSMSNEVLISELARYRAMCEQISITPMDIAVNIETPNHAAAECVVKVKLTGANFEFDEIRHFITRLQKIDKSWKITGIADDQVLVK